MIGTIDIKLNAAHPNLPLSPIVSLSGSPSNVRLLNVPRAIGKWCLTSVSIGYTLPDNTVGSVACVLTGGAWSATIPGCATVGTVNNGIKVTAAGKDETGADIGGYKLGAATLAVLACDTTVTVGTTKYALRYCTTTPATPSIGDCIVNGAFKFWNGTNWVALGGGASWGTISGTLSDQEDLSDALALKADAADLTAHESSTTAHSSLFDEKVGTEHLTAADAHSTLFASKLDATHASDSGAHSDLFAAKLGVNAQAADSAKLGGDTKAQVLSAASTDAQTKASAAQTAAVAYANNKVITGYSYWEQIPEAYAMTDGAVNEIGEVIDDDVTIKIPVPAIEDPPSGVLNDKIRDFAILFIVDDGVTPTITLDVLDTFSTLYVPPFVGDEISGAAQYLMAVQVVPLMGSFQEFTVLASVRKFEGLI